MVCTMADTIHEVVIVGSGVLGSVMATVLARDGRNVTVIERSLAPPSRIAGELLQPGGIQALEELGLAECIKSTDGVECVGFHLTDCLTGTKVALPYPAEDTGMSFHHGNFVMSLRRLALAEGRTHYIEGNVTSLIEENHIIKGVVVRRKNSEEKEEIRAELTIVADGSFSRLRGVNVKGKPVTCGYFIGMEYSGVLGRPGHLDIYTTRENAFLVYQITADTSRILTDVKGPMPKDTKQYLRNECQDLPVNIRDAVLATIDEGKICSTPTFQFPGAASFQPGVITLGDAFNMRHPVTGADSVVTYMYHGMTVASKDAIIWRDLIRGIPSLSDTEAVRAAHNAFLSRRKAHCVVVNSYAYIFYNVLMAKTDTFRFIRSSFCDYVKSETNMRDIMAIGGVTQTRLSVFLYHMVALTAFSAWKALKGGADWWSLPRDVSNSASVSYRAVTLLASLLWAEVPSLY